MANIKISDLPAASSVAVGDLFEVSQGSGTLSSRKATATQVQSFVLGSYAGATSITTLGTVGTGTWQASVVAGAYGGTGASTAAGARSNLGLAIGTNVQAWDADLDAIASLAGTSGLLKKTAANVWSLDTSTYLTTAVTSFSAGTTGLTPSTGTTGAVTLAGTLAVANGGTGATVAGTARSNLGAATAGANSDITSLSGLTTALSVAQGGTGATTAAAARTSLGVVIGTDVQAYDAELAAIAGLTSVADRLPYFTGSGTAALATFTAFGRSLVDDADAATARTTLGLGTAATMTGPTGTIVGTTDTQTLSNKRVMPRTSSVTASGTVTPTGDAADQYEIVATGALTIAAPGGTPTNGQRLIIRIKNNGTVTSQTITWTTTAGAYRVIGVTLPAATPTSATTGVHYVGCLYNAADGFWDVLAVGTL